MALSIVLLAGAGLLFRTLAGLQAVDPGLNATNVFTFRVSLPNARYREAGQRLQFFDRALAKMGALPGVRSAGAINSLPFFGMPSGTGIHIGGHPPAQPGESPVASIRTVMPGYFAAMGIPIRQGPRFRFT